MYRFLIAILLFSTFSHSLLADEKVVLQLKWEHEYQFAGYYAAKWQGFYKDAGIDVEIRPSTQPNGQFVKPVEAIVNGSADFAIGSLDILIARDQGTELTILAPIFQHSPSVIFSLQETQIESLAQLAKLRIAAAPGDPSKLEVEALFRSHGYTLEDIQFVDVPVTLDSLLQGKADAISTYQVSGEFEASEKGLQLNTLTPADFGINFYGDTLFTTHQLTQNNPELVRKFVAASKKGWLYALENKHEIATRITNELPRHLIHYDNPLAYNLAFADKIHQLMDYPATPIGQINQEHWHAINERIRSIGVLHSPLSKEVFFFEPTPLVFDLSNKIIFYPTITILVLLLFYVWYRRWLIISIITISITTYFIQHHFEHALEDQHAQELKLSLTQQLNAVSAKLEGDIKTNFSMINSFAAYIAINPELTEQKFNNYAQQIFAKVPLVLRFSVAKDLVVNQIYPLEGNETVIGLDYQKDVKHKEIVRQVLKTGQSFIVGPLTLNNESNVFTVHAPIYTGDRNAPKFWGIVSAQLSADLLYRNSGIKKRHKEFNLAIKSYDLLGIQRPTFIGDDHAFHHPQAIRSVISVGGGSWHLAASPVAGSSDTPVNIFILRIAAFVTSLCLVILFILRFRQTRERETMQKSLIDHQRLLEKVGSVAQIGGWKLGKDLNFIQWSSQTSLLLGQSEEFRPTNLAGLEKLFDHEQSALLSRKVNEAFSGTQSIDFDLSLSLPNKETVWLRVIASVAHPSTDRLTGTMQNVTDKVKSAQLIQHQASYDSLTNLPNRVLFNDRLTHAIENAQRNQNQIAVLFIDLNDFKPVNDNYGHLIGDKLLIQAAERILPCVRESDTVSRLGGDEFGVLLVNINHFDDVTLLTDKIIAAMQLTYLVDGNSLHCSASIGISIYPNDGEQAGLLLRNADQAMYMVKKSGRNGWHFYTHEMQQQSEYRHRLLNELKMAIANNELLPHFQPIYDLKSNRLVKCEALARWPKSDGSFVSPLEFITLAEETGLVNDIDLKILKSASQVLVASASKKENRKGLAINVSPRLFQTKDRALETWLSSIEEISQKLDITVEITERLLTEDSQKALDVLNRLKSFGIKVALDDFGTGYSSLSYLINFPVDIIKIDQSFVAAIGQDSSAESLIETLMIMAKKLDVKVVAEGVETQQQLQFLQNLDCDFAQGYFLARPMPEREFMSLIQKELSS